MKNQMWVVLRVVMVVALATPVTVRVASAARSRPSARARAAVVPVKPVRASLSVEALDKLRELLAGSDQGAVVSATKALGESTAPNASQPLVELLATGATPAVTVAAIDALAKLRDPSAIEVLTVYSGNRNADTRRHAVAALGAFSEARVVPTLIERLGDPAPDVRAAAADALSVRGEKAAAPRLFALLKRNDAGAAGPLGTVAPVSMLPAIAELQGSIDDANLASTLGELMKRHDVPEPLRLDIVKNLARVPGPAATTALVEYIGTLATADNRGSKVEAQKIIDERSKQK